jgi:hypothetical protein
VAITVGSAGTWTYAASGSVTPTLSTHATGDMLLVRVSYKSSAIASCAASTATSGWAKVGEFYDGAGNNSGNGTGSVNVAVFWKVATSAAETDPTIDFSQTVTHVGHVAVVYQKGAGESWVTPVGDGGYDGTADASKSMTIASHVSVTAGDLVDVFMGIRDNTTMTSPAFTQTGVTYGSVLEFPVTAGESLTGDDGANDGCYRIASSGTSSAAAVVTGTLDTSETGSAWMTRLRVESGTSANAGVATGTAAANADTAKVEARGTGYGAATGEAYTADGLPGARGLAGVGAATGAAYGSTSYVSGTLAAAAATGSTQAAWGALGVYPGFGASTGAALDATAETAVGAITFNAEVATATAAALAGNVNLAASLGFAQGRSS